jgi:hypothetical protein
MPVDCAQWDFFVVHQKDAPQIFEDGLSRWTGVRDSLAFAGNHESRRRLESLSSCASS